MKYITIISLLILPACSKDCMSTGINGEWIWKESVGTWGTITPENTGERRELRINDFIYKEIINDSIVYESQYDLVVRIDSVNGDQTYIIFPSGYEEEISISESRLVRIDLWHDGYSHYYDRK